MINVSKGFARNLLNDNRNYKYFIDITLSNGKVLNITNANLWLGTFRIEDSVSQDNNLDVGDAIINKLSFSIDNIDNSYSEYDFTDASVVAYIALDVNEELEKLKKFTGIVDETTYNGSLISITAFDNMSKGDKDFDTSGIEFPVSIGELVLYCSTKMGIPLGTTKFPNMEFVVESLPNGSSSAITYRQVISWCAQICGCFARCNRNGELEIKWYPTEYLFEQLADGGTFDTTTTPYSDGDNVDGGTFNTTTTPYSDGASIDAGVFTSVEGPHYFTSYSSHNLGVDDVVITGVSVKTKEQDSEFATSGSSGYVIAIENNPFVTEDNKQSIANFIGKQIIGVKFRTLTANVLSDPSVEAGDVGFFYGLNHNYYPILISSVTFSAGGYMSIRSSAKTPARNKAVTYSEETKNYVDLRKKIAIEKSIREIQEQKLNEALNSSSGLYTTIEKGSTGNIYYFHNHKDLSDSDIVWKMTAEAWGVSTDGGKTFNGGMTVDGDTITRILTATGINADWIIAGKIKDKDSTNYWNLDTGEFKLSPNTKIGDSTVSSKSYADNAANEAKAAASKLAQQAQTTADNKITTFYQNEAPTSGMSNGDLWIDTNDGNTMHRYNGKTWDNIQDSDINKALNDAKTAKSTADGKIVTFAQSTQPTATDVGDIWIDTDDNNKLYRWSGSSWVAYRDGMIAESLTQAKSYADNAVKSQTQTDIFNKLTNNGETQGIYLDGEKLYINAEYIATGILKDKNSTNYWNLDTGEFKLSASTKVGDSNIVSKSDLVSSYYTKTEIDAKADSIELSVSNTYESKGTARAHYATCSTASSTAAKAAACSGFELYEGAIVNVYFTYKNTAASPTLNVNSTGAKSIYVGSSAMTTDTSWDAGTTMQFVYTGSYWRVSDSGSISSLKVLADSIGLSVSGSLGGTASIVLSANGKDFTQDLDLSEVRSAFANDSSSIVISSGKVTFNSNTFVVNSTNFSVTSTGEITSTSGTIGGFSITSSYLYSGKASLSSDTSGVYLGTNGISVGSGTAYTALAGGYLRGGLNSNITGYVGFNNYWATTGTYGTRIAGRGCIALLTNGVFGIGSYYSFNSDATITTGRTGSIQVVTDISTGWTPAEGRATWSYKEIGFTKGIMTTDL